MVEGQESMQDVLLNGALDSVIDSLGDSAYIKQVVEQTQNQQGTGGQSHSVRATMRSMAAVSQGTDIPDVAGIANVVAGADTAAQMLDAMNAAQAMQQVQNAGKALNGANVVLPTQPTMATIELPAMSGYESASNQVQQMSPAPVLNQMKNRLPMQQTVATGGMPSSPGNAAAELRRAQQQSRVGRDAEVPQVVDRDSAPSAGGTGFSDSSTSGVDNINTVGANAPESAAQAGSMPTAEDLAQAGRTLQNAADSAATPQAPEALEDSDDTDSDSTDSDLPQVGQPQGAQPTQQSGGSQPTAGDNTGQSGGEQAVQQMDENQGEELDDNEDAEDSQKEDQQPDESIEEQDQSGEESEADGDTPETAEEIGDPANANTGDLQEGIQPTDTNLGGTPGSQGIPGGTGGVGPDISSGATPEISKLPANSIGSSATKGASNAASSIAKDQASKRLKQQAGKQLKKQAAKQIAKKSATVAAEAALGPEILAGIAIVLAAIAVIGVWIFMLLFIVWLLDQGDLGFIREIIGLGISNFLTILEGLMSILSSIVF